MEIVNTDFPLMVFSIGAERERQITPSFLLREHRNFDYKRPGVPLNSVDVRQIPYLIG